MHPTPTTAEVTFKSGGHSASLRHCCTTTMRVCGPKLSMCGIVLSLWGIVQLALMSWAFHVRSVSLVEDLALKPHYDDVNELNTDMERGYDKGANNCLVAAMLYGVTLLVSLHQHWLNNRVEPQGYQRHL